MLWAPTFPSSPPLTPQFTSCTSLGQSLSGIRAASVSWLLLDLYLFLPMCASSWTLRTPFLLNFFPHLRPSWHCVLKYCVPQLRAIWPFVCRNHIHIHKSLSIFYKSSWNTLTPPAISACPIEEAAVSCNLVPRNTGNVWQMRARSSSCRREDVINHPLLSCWGFCLPSSCFWVQVNNSNNGTAHTNTFFIWRLPSLALNTFASRTIIRHPVLLSRNQKGANSQQGTKAPLLTSIVKQKRREELVFNR